MGNVFFLSDLHLGHRNIIRYRERFKTIEEHDDTIERNYQSVVTKRDKVFFLGDIAFTKDSLNRIKKWNGMRKICILGNHDFERSGLTVRDYLEVFDEIHGFVKYKKFWLSHAPIHPDELRGKLNIHGHVHRKNIEDGNYLNVSMDNTNFKPIELKEVIWVFEQQNKQADGEINKG